VALSPVGEFFFVFAVVAGIELLDRSNFALIAYASDHPAWPTWIGGVTALAAATLLALGIGSLLIALLQGELVYLRLAGGVVLLGYAAFVAFSPEREPKPQEGRATAAGAFAMIFLLEFFDTSMIFIIILVATIGNPLLVGSAAVLAFVAVASTAVLIGARLGPRVEPRYLNRIVVVVLSVVGVLTILSALVPALFPELTV
jgi:putative Ca2+/H+ antiporter (TMEM165/GDT1 family)